MNDRPFLMLSVITLALLTGSPLHGQNGAELPLRGMKLRFSKASEVAKTLTEQFPPLSFSANDSSRHIYYRGTEEQQFRIDEFVLDIERDAQTVQEEQNALEEEMANKVRMKRAEDEPVPQNSDAPQFIVFRLTHVDGNEAVKLLTDLRILDENTRVTVLPGGTTIGVFGSQAVIDRAREFLSIVDVPFESSNADNSIFSEARVLELRSQYERDEQAVKDLAAKIQANKDGDQATELGDSLQQAVRQAFQSRQSWQEAQIESQLAKLGELKSRVVRRTQLADKIVTQRVKDLLKPEDAEVRTTRLAGEVSIQTLPDQGLIIVKGGKKDVQATVDVIKKIDAGTVKTLDIAEPAAPETEVMQLPFCGSSLTLESIASRFVIRAESEQFLESVPPAIKSLTNRQPRDGVHGSEFRYAIEEKDLIISAIRFLEAEYQAQTLLQKSSDVQIQLQVPPSTIVRWPGTDETFAGTGRFQMNANHHLLLELHTTKRPSVYVSFDIPDVSAEALKYFSLHALPIAIGVNDLHEASLGSRVVKAVYRVNDQISIERKNSDWKPADDPAWIRERKPKPQRRSNPSDMLEQMMGDMGFSERRELLAVVTMGSSRPEKYTDSIPISPLPRDGNPAPVDIMESIVFVELVVSSNDQAQASKAVYTDGTIVGDEGLIAIVMDELTNDTQELLGKVQKITIKTSSGTIFNDGELVMHDGESNLGLIRSPSLEQHPLIPSNLQVVANQVVEICGLKRRDSAFLPVFEKGGWSQPYIVESPTGSDGNFPSLLKLKSQNGIYNAGAAVVLATTGEFLGILTERDHRDGTEYHNGYVIPAASISQVLADRLQQLSKRTD